MRFYKYFDRLYVVRGKESVDDIFRKGALNKNKKMEMKLLHSYEDVENIKVNRSLISDYYVIKYGIRTCIYM